MTRAVTEAEFDGFYTAHFGDTVAMTYGLTANIDEARDIAQEAFCRAWKRWPHLSAYDNPVIWVRRVATNLAYSRWRHLRVATTHMLRHRADNAMAAQPDADHVTVVAGLRKLPRDQCTALVLHHMLDLPVTQVAQHLDVPVGRVKMWLHRGRQALAAELGQDFKSPAPQRIPPVDQEIQRAKERHRKRKAATKAAAFVLAMLAAAVATNAVQSARRLRQPGNVPPAQVTCTVDTAARISIATGNATGVYFALGSAYAEQIPVATGGKVRATAAETGTSMQNITQLVAGDYQVAFSLADTAADAVRGKDSFDKPQPVQALARIYSNSIHVLARTDSGITTVADMKGKRISTGSSKSGTEVVANRLLRAAGLDPDKDISRHRLDLTKTVDGMKDGTIDAMFFSGGLPTPGITDLVTTAKDKVKFIDISPLTTEMNRINPAYEEGVIPATTYKTAADVKTIVVPNVLLVKDDIDANLACVLTKALYDKQPELVNANNAARGITLDIARRTTPVMLNRGAEKALDTLDAPR